MQSNQIGNNLISESGISTNSNNNRLSTNSNNTNNRLSTNSNNNNIEDIKKENNMRSGFMLNFLHERYGEEKFSLLIELLETSNNPLETLQDEEKIVNIVGEDFKIAQKFLRIVFKNTPNKDI